MFQELKGRLDLRALTLEELECWVEGEGFEPYRARQLFKWLWTPGVKSFLAMKNLPLALRKRLEERAFLYELRLVRVQESVDRTRKIAWGLMDGSLVESVIIPERGYNTICVSTQVGCSMGCRFCRTARMGFRRDLSPSEMATQVISSIELLGGRDRLRNVVFMGMGEPLNNYENLSRALRILMEGLGLDFSRRRITVSTSGIVPGIKRLGRDFDVGLAVSLHAPDNGLRSKLMPVNRLYGLGELLNALETYPLPRRRRITIEYLLLRGINDKIEDARRLSRILSRIRTKINLIPFNEVPGIAFKCPEEGAVLEFQRVLLERGYTATIRKSKGADIDAACGQLYARLSRPGS